MLQTILAKTEDQPESAELTLDLVNELKEITLILLRYIAFDFTIHLELIFVLVDHSRGTL